MKLTKEILNDYIAKGLVEESRHNTLPLSIYNYSRDCQFQGNWDWVTLMCRGLIMDDQERIIGRGFNKFFNYEELTHSVPWTSSDYVYVQEKMDGSLGILFYYAGDWHLATKGSFHSEQAVRGMEIIKEKFFLRAFMREYAYVVEIIYPENRIVVEYPEPKITFLSVFLNRAHPGWTDGGDDELHWTTANSVFAASAIHKKHIVETEQVFDGLGHDLYKTLKAKNLQNKEGYILRFFPSNFRCKIKFEDYVRLHRIITNFSNVDIWEAMMIGQNLGEALTDVPDEFDAWVKSVQTELQSQFDVIENEYKRIYKSIMSNPDAAGDRKVFAQFALLYKYPSILFSMRDGKSYAESIWKNIRPVYSKPFWAKSNS